MTYTVTVGSATNATPTSGSVTFDIYNTRSEAVHVNLVGYVAATDHKAADLYAWLGNGGARDYTSFEGNTVYVNNVGTGQAIPIVMVTFWKPSGSDVFFYNLTRSAVWNVDFPGFTSPGTYRLAVQGVGCSQDFTIANDVYGNPFRVSLRGFYSTTCCCPQLFQAGPTAIAAWANAPIAERTFGAPAVPHLAHRRRARKEPGRRGGETEYSQIMLPENEPPVIRPVKE